MRPVSCCRRYLSQVFPLPGAEARAVSLPGAAFSLGAPRHQEIFSLCSASLLSCTEVQWGEPCHARLLPDCVSGSSSCPCSELEHGGDLQSGSSSPPGSWHLICRDDGVTMTHFRGNSETSFKIYQNEKLMRLPNENKRQWGHLPCDWDQSGDHAVETEDCDYQ